MTPAFWRGKRVLLTGHTGFKGSWMALLLQTLGAEVTGIALEPNTGPSLFEILGLEDTLDSCIQDIRSRDWVATRVAKAKPQIVIHMAAQPLVRLSYNEPVFTAETNILGTVYLLDALRAQKQLEAALIVTSDKVYDNREQRVAFAENAALGGSDPYSASKAACEIMARSYAQSFGLPVATARAGNVIGGGDWSEDRLIPDLWRAFERKTPVELRHPEAVRPWQHVLEPLFGYLTYIEKLIAGGAPTALNFGPAEGDVCSVQKVAEQFSQALNASGLWNAGTPDPNRKESGYLAIDASLAKQTLGWSSRLSTTEAIRWTSDWYKAFHGGQDMKKFSLAQIAQYQGLAA